VNGQRWPFFIPLLALSYAPFIAGGLLTDDFVHFQKLSSQTSVADIIGQPDAFKFYRPVTQASLALELAVHGDRPPLFRAVNIALHAMVLSLALVVARLILGSSLAAAFATLAFALTPKAPPIAVLWISGRAELLMALFSFVAIAAWIVWSRNGGTRWLAVAGGAYVLAAFSKETAFLLPLLLVLTPGQLRPRTTWLIGLSVLVVLGLAAFLWRSHVGALTPLSGDEHYDLLTGIARIARGLRNYIGRMIAAPLALVALLAIARSVDMRQAARPAGTYAILATALVFPLVWMLVFLAAVLPVVARSELYLYVPVFGMCLIAGALGMLFRLGLERHRAAVAAVVLFLIVFGAYQLWRAAAMSRYLDFSARLVAALRADPELAARGGTITLVSADANTERFLRDSIGGYLYAVLRRAFPDGRVTGTTQYAGTTPPPEGRRIVCRYAKGVVGLSREGGP
jgi:hypothetical protein